TVVSAVLISISSAALTPSQRVFPLPSAPTALPNSGILSTESSTVLILSRGTAGKLRFSSHFPPRGPSQLSLPITPQRDRNHNLFAPNLLLPPGPSFSRRPPRSNSESSRVGPASTQQDTSPAPPSTVPS